jgi:hypothetical protein
MANIFSNQNIQNFYQTAYKKDFARKNLFRVVGIQTGIAGLTFDDTDLVYVTSASLPQRAINNVKVPFMGMSFNVPGTANYPGNDGWKIKFRMPQDLSIRAKLEAWTRVIFNDATTTGAYGLNNLGTIWISLMSKGGQPIRNYKLIGAYCVSMGDYGLDVTDGGTIVEQEATIAYQYWENF